MYFGDGFTRTNFIQMYLEGRVCLGGVSFLPNLILCVFHFSLYLWPHLIFPTPAQMKIVIGSLSNTHQINVQNYQGES